MKLRKGGVVIKALGAGGEVVVYVHGFVPFLLSEVFKFGFIGGMHISFINQIHQWGRGPMGVSTMLPTIKSLGISMLFESFGDT